MIFFIHLNFLFISDRKWRFCFEHAQNFHFAFDRSEGFHIRSYFFAMTNNRLLLDRPADRIKSLFAVRLATNHERIMYIRHCSKSHGAWISRAESGRVCMYVRMLRIRLAENQNRLSRSSQLAFVVRTRHFRFFVIRLFLFVFALFRFKMDFIERSHN